MARAVTGFDVARRWAEDWALLYAAENRDNGRAYANAWPPAGGVAVLMSNRLPPAAQEATVAAAANTPSAANMPSAAKAHIAAIERTVPLPPSVPPAMHSDRGKHRSTGRKTPLHIEPKVAALPPQAPEPGYFNFFRKLFVDPNDEAAHALLAANPQTAIYDIKDHVVYLPGGTKLEAHSGYGKWLDDPSSVRRKDLGVTPPNVYSVSFREKLFHGVRALRLTPVGDGNMYGRDGMLAHTYMLGRNGQSNGCVSVKDYQKFLQAYEHGKFNRLIVVRSVEDSTPAQVASAAPGNV